MVSTGPSLSATLCLPGRVCLPVLTYVFLSPHVYEHTPVCGREKSIWKPGERPLAEERHTLETDLRPCGQVGWMVDESASHYHDELAACVA